MSKSKNAPALFELYDKAREIRPPNAGDGAGYPGRTPVAESASAFRSTLSNLARSIGGLGRSEAVVPAVEAEDSASVVVAGERRLELSAPWWLVWVGCVLCCLLLLAIFLTGQWIGRQGGIADGRLQERAALQRSAMDEIELARRSRPVDGLFDGLGAASPVKRQVADPAPVPLTAARPREEITARRAPLAPPQVAPVVANPWVKGLSYVVVQHFRRGLREDAVRVQAFVGKRGVEARIVGDGRDGYRLISTTGFDNRNPTQKELCKRFLDKIHQIGKAYADFSNGRYKLDGYIATLTGDAW